jgi:pimeloyl-ACP methyl ester carboxylesterase
MKSIVVALSSLVLLGCASNQPSTNLASIYNVAAQHIGDERNPVVVIPGILGSKLESAETDIPIWGAFIYGAADPETPEGARLVALPMKIGASLSELKDDVVATEVLDTLSLDVSIIRGMELSAYVDILRVLAAGKYRDQTLGQSGAIDYGGLHYTCFQLPYDWRRDISEQAARLHELINEALVIQPSGRATKVDVVAHSMGGLVLRYYLRYGPDPLPEDGSLPELDWEGAQYIDTAILVGTPSAGSVLALEQLVKGINFVSLITPRYRPAILGTMPAIYQLLPRPRHARVIDRVSGEAIDILDPGVWEDLGWGLANPEQDSVLRQLLPDVETAEGRRKIALDHLAKSLRKAEQLFRALDTPAVPPPDLSIYLVAGDAHPTPDVLSVDTKTGKLDLNKSGPGDETVTRSSALMDERIGTGYVPRLRSPVPFESVYFLMSNHMGLTKDPLFQNYVLYNLLERPR